VGGVAGAATTAGGGRSTAGRHGPEPGAEAVAAGPRGFASPRCLGDRGTAAGVEEDGRRGVWYGDREVGRRLGDGGDPRRRARKP
jgi:hypothetical protein